MDRSTDANTTQPNPGGVWHPQNVYSRTVSRQHPLPQVLHYLLPSHLLVLFKRLPLLLHGYNLQKQALHCARCAPDITACPYKLNKGGAPGYHSLHTGFLRASCSQFKTWSTVKLCQFLLMRQALTVKQTSSYLSCLS